MIATQPPPQTVNPQMPPPPTQAVANQVVPVPAVQCPPVMTTIPSPTNTLPNGTVSPPLASASGPLTAAVQPMTQTVPPVMPAQHTALPPNVQQHGVVVGSIGADDLMNNQKHSYLPQSSSPPVLYTYDNGPPPPHQHSPPGGTSYVQQQPAVTVPFYPYLIIPHVHNSQSPVNLNAGPSVDPSGSDLPHNGKHHLHMVYNNFCRNCL